MVLTAAQTTAFFRNEDQMGVPQGSTREIQSLFFGATKRVC